ncbi:hypothetical protein GCM10010441_07790 [Kitasatospora paracochleata]|uniref:DUF2993 domain-containing protein n=1 Tax=Kitasatospora paracochleata TaxID=58354 RepID=A0ABT1J9N3_9ACTN|nr:hypothetical protein [Kitasatospora paracochleata]MCP2314145.1 hypothetical protein [Kitasatospora paracochleata]
MSSPDPRGPQANNASGNATQNITQSGDIVLGEAPEEAGRRAKHNRFVKIAISVGLIVAVAVGFAVFRIEQQSQTTNDLARKGPELKSDLTLSKVSAYIAGGTSGEQRYGEEVTKTTDLHGPHIDLTLANIANGTSLITKASITFNQLQSLAPCSAEGGEIVVSANYQFTIPDDQQPVPPAKPFTLSKEIAFEVVANRHDALELSLGNKTIIEGVSPWIAVVNVVLEHDGGQQLTVGPIAVVNTGDISTFYPDGDQWVMPENPAPGCIEKNTKLVSDILKTPNLVVSKEVASLDRTLQRFKK